MTEYIRIDGRKAGQLRPVKLTAGFVDYPEGSVLIEAGQTRVLCNATIEQGVPRWLEKSQPGSGWITAEYALLPRSTQQRVNRDNATGSRSQEIRRLIGRSLRAAVDLQKLGPRTITLDCDVLQADGGTRTASVTGAYIAVVIALRGLIQAGACPPEVLAEAVAAVSVGIYDGQAILDLNYAEDSHAETDLNVVMNASGKFIEVQGTAEKNPYSRQQLDQMLDLAASGIQELLAVQQSTLAKL